MAPKINCNPLKLASIVTYLQKSRVAHTIKDLEKHLPSVASINGMQVKDYVQNLQDENKIRVEKIGSGNWYWSFTSEEKANREKALAVAQTAHDTAVVAKDHLRAKIAEAAAQRQDDEDMLDQGGDCREDLEAAKVQLTAEIKALTKDLAAYSDSDPTELERKRKEAQEFRADADACTDDIYAMEGWFGKLMGRDGVARLRSGLYGETDEFDPESGMLRELD